MQVRLHVLAIFTVALLLCSVALAQTPATGTVTIQGWDLGPIYPCGNSSCPTYDSGSVQLTVGGFTATSGFSHTIGQSTAEALAIKLASQLNGTNSPVVATRSNTRLVLTSKASGLAANYALSAAVTHTTLFPAASFSVITSGSSLTGGTAGSGGSVGSGGTGGKLPAPVGTLLKQISNNTSLCSSANDPGGNKPYCTSFFNGFSTHPINVSAQTPLPDAAAGHVSNISVRHLMYPGWNGRVLCEYQPWFGLKSHKSVGYNQNSPATIAAQNNFMIAEGCDVNLIDFYGSLDLNQRFNLATTNTIFADLNARGGYPLRFGIMEDKGALKSSCPSGMTAAATVTCLQNALRTDMDYIHTHYAQSGVYWTDAGWPVIAYFGGISDFPVLSAADWDAVWIAVKAHTDRYAIPFKFVFQYGGKFTLAPYDNGRYAWAQPAPFATPAQMWWGSRSNPSPIYLDSFYTTSLNHPSQLAIGALYKGFDDSNASWSGNRVTAQQCGQVLMNTAKEISKFYGGSNPQLPYVQVVTWNDYEEGTAVESGIDNCYSVHASLSGNLLSWSLQSSDTYASPSTVHHFTVYYADATGTLYHAAASVPVSTASLDLSTIVPPGTWSVYVEMVGQPLIINRMSNAVTLIH